MGWLPWVIPFARSIQASAQYLNLQPMNPLKHRVPGEQHMILTQLKVPLIGKQPSLATLPTYTLNCPVSVRMRVARSATLLLAS